jgi:hypothetical protein
MSEELELKLIQKIEELEKEIQSLKKENVEQIPTYSFSNIKFNDLEELVDIKQIFLQNDIFNYWFNANIEISKDDIKFLTNLINENIDLINLYHEEDLKINFIAPLIKKVNFFMIDKDIRNFFNEKITYKSDNFIFSGEADFIFSKGIKKAIKPYFFIQEFKKGFENTNPEPQLLAELISAVELNNENIIKGAYIIGENWTFVILQRLEKHKYQYYVSRTYNCVNIEDLKSIYKNLLFVKNETLEVIDHIQ